MPLPVKRRGSPGREPQYAKLCLGNERGQRGVAFKVRVQPFFLEARLTATTILVALQLLETKMIRRSFLPLVMVCVMVCQLCGIGIRHAHATSSDSAEFHHPDTATNKAATRTAPHRIDVAFQHLEKMWDYENVQRSRGGSK